MTDALDTLKHQIDQCTDQERKLLFDHLRTKLPDHPLEKEWGISAEIILSAISRSSDLTKRGVRGIIAEAVFERNILSHLKGWKVIPFVEDKPYDFLLQSPDEKPREAHIQVKLQRMLKQQPMRAVEANRNYPSDMHVVEVQKTRGGFDPQTNEDTRPYRFGEFDVLAVNLHPSTRDWNRFLYTLSGWLLARYPDTNLIEIFQPVPSAPNDVWTDNLAVCFEWLKAGENKTIFKIDPKLLERRTRIKPAEK